MGSQKRVLTCCLTNQMRHKGSQIRTLLFVRSWLCVMTGSQQMMDREIPEIISNSQLYFYTILTSLAYGLTLQQEIKGLKMEAVREFAQFTEWMVVIYQFISICIRDDEQSRAMLITFCLEHLSIYNLEIFKEMNTIIINYTIFRRFLCIGLSPLSKRDDSSHGYL